MSSEASFVQAIPVGFNNLDSINEFCPKGSLISLRCGAASTEPFVLELKPADPPKLVINGPSPVEVEVLSGGNVVGQIRLHIGVVSETAMDKWVHIADAQDNRTGAMIQFNIQKVAAARKILESSTYTEATTIAPGTYTEVTTTTAPAGYRTYEREFAVESTYTTSTPIKTAATTFCPDLGPEYREVTGATYSPSTIRTEYTHIPAGATYSPSTIRTEYTHIPAAVYSRTQYHTKVPDIEELLAGELAALKTRLVQLGISEELEEVIFVDEDRVTVGRRAVVGGRVIVDKDEIVVEEEGGLLVEAPLQGMVADIIRIGARIKERTGTDPASETLARLFVSQANTNATLATEYVGVSAGGLEAENRALKEELRLLRSGPNASQLTYEVTEPLQQAHYNARCAAANLCNTFNAMLVSGGVTGCETAEPLLLSDRPERAQELQAVADVIGHVTQGLGNVIHTLQYKDVMAGAAAARPAMVATEREMALKDKLAQKKALIKELKARLADLSRDHEAMRRTQYEDQGLPQYLRVLVLNGSTFPHQPTRESYITTAVGSKSVQTVAGFGPAPKWGESYIFPLDEGETCVEFSVQGNGGGDTWGSNTLSIPATRAQLRLPVTEGNHPSYINVLVERGSLEYMVETAAAEEEAGSARGIALSPAEQKLMSKMMEDLMGIHDGSPASVDKMRRLLAEYNKNPHPALGPYTGGLGSGDALSPEELEFFYKILNHQNGNPMGGTADIHKLRKQMDIYNGGPLQSANHKPGAKTRIIRGARGSGRPQDRHTRSGNHYHTHTDTYSHSKGKKGKKGPGFDDEDEYGMGGDLSAFLMRSRAGLVHRIWLCHQLGQNSASLIDKHYAKFEKNHGHKQTLGDFTAMQEVIKTLKKECHMLYDTLSWIVRNYFTDDEKLDLGTSPTLFPADDHTRPLPGLIDSMDIVKSRRVGGADFYEPPNVRRAQRSVSRYGIKPEPEEGRIDSDFRRKLENAHLKVLDAKDGKMDGMYFGHDLKPLAEKKAVTGGILGGPGGY